jgi:HAMP domain-containing protein
MKIATKFNTMLIGVFVGGLLVTGAVTYVILNSWAQDEVSTRARLMMQAALAMRGYTIDEIRPLLAPHMSKEFLPQTVPAYAASQAFSQLRQEYAEYTYKEATINPTNPRNRATDWETDIVREFADHPERTEITNVRETPSGPSLFLARPIRIKKEACLACHDQAKDAPATMVARYGDRNGFGWKLNEVVGAQIVSVPMSVPIAEGRRAFMIVMLTVAGVFIAIALALHFMLRLTITQRLRRLAEVADDVSTGKEGADDFSDDKDDEIGALANSFERMRFSLQRAMKLLES